MRSYRYVLLAVAVAALMFGCVNYDETIKLNADGTGTIDVHYSTSKSNLPSDTTEMSVLPPQFVFEESAAEEKWTGTGVTMSSFSTEEKVEEGDTIVHAHMTLSFDELASLGSPIEGFAGRSATFSAEDGISVSLVVGENEGGEVDTTDQFTFTYTLGMPGAIVETNGDKVDESTVRWEYSSSQVKNSQYTLTAKAEAGKAFPIIVVVVAAAVVVVIIVVVLLMGKKKQPQPQE
jgi:hypothetical protein